MNYETVLIGFHENRGGWQLKGKEQNMNTQTYLVAETFYANYTHTHTQKKNPWILQSLFFFLALMVTIAFWKTGNNEPRDEPVVMVIQLFLMGTISIMNL